MTPQETEPKPPASVGGSAAEVWVDRGSGTGRWAAVILEGPLILLGVTINPTIKPTGPRAGSSQAKKLRGRECSPIHQQIKALLSMALPTRARPSFFHHQSFPSGNLHKPLSLLYQRADRRSKKNHNPTVTKTKTTLQKVNQDEKNIKSYPS